MTERPDMWCGTVEQVGSGGFIIALLGDEGVVAVDKMLPGVRVGQVVTIYTTGEVDEDGNAVIECEFADPDKELAN